MDGYLHSYRKLHRLIHKFFNQIPKISHRKTAHRHSNSTTEAIAAITTVMATAKPADLAINAGPGI